MPPTSAAFRDLLLDLDTAALTAFVSAVYAARGWDVERDGDALLIRAGGERNWLRLVVAPDADHDSADADRVVVPTLVADAEAGRVIDAAALLELAWYAVDEADRTRLFREFFGRDPSEFEAPADADGSGGRTTADESSANPTTATSTDSVGETDATPDTLAASPPDAVASEETTGFPDDRTDDAAPATESSRLVGRRLAVVVVGLLVIGGVAVAVGPTLVPSSDGGGSAPGAAAGENTTDAPAAPDAPGDASIESQDDSGLKPSDGVGAATVDGPFPPGVDAAGIENASALVDAHEAALDGRSYRLSVVAREFVGGRPTAVARERTVVESPTRYRSDVDVIGTFRQEPRAIGTVSAYANGTTRFVRLTTATDADGTIRFTDRGVEAQTAGGPGWRSVAIDRTDDPFANRTASHLRGILDVDDAAIVGSFERDGTTYVWIDLRRRPPGGTDVIDSVLVDEHGLVHEIRHEYAYLPPEASTVRTVTTVRIEPANVTATPPPWL